ncbi:MAG: hypothetical protein HQL70_09515 [Magnetococcales bacterium]|nr:hypothetical protein [Magnetococcales bacterium]
MTTNKKRPEDDQLKEELHKDDQLADLGHTGKNNRRHRKRDIVLLIFMLLSIVCWVFFVLALIDFAQAIPETQNVFSRHLDIKIRDYWNISAVRSVINMLYYVAGFSFLAVVLKAFRNRRRTDSYPLSLIIVFVFSIGAIIILNVKLIN